LLVFYWTGVGGSTTQAQGVFGFINSHRVSLVLHYTHDPLPLLDAQTTKAIARCKDTAGVAVHDQQGNGYQCDKLGQQVAISHLCNATC
jgi:hypothetical protein